MTHVGDDGDFDVNIEVFDLMGRQVAHVYQRVICANGVIEPVRWDGRSQFGYPLRSGVYVYRLTLTDSNGFSRTVSQRMIIER